MLLPLSMDEVLTVLRHVLDLQEVNWLLLLSLVSVTIVCLPHADKHFLVTGLLLARQACLQGPHVYMSYPDWFQKTFSDGGTSPASTRRSFTFFIKFLSDLMPYETAQHIKSGKTSVSVEVDSAVRVFMDLDSDDDMELSPLEHLQSSLQHLITGKEKTAKHTEMELVSCVCERVEGVLSLTPQQTLDLPLCITLNIHDSMMDIGVLKFIYLATRLTPELRYHDMDMLVVMGTSSCVKAIFTSDVFQKILQKHMELTWAISTSPTPQLPWLQEQLNRLLIGCTDDTGKQTVVSAFFRLCVCLPPHLLWSDVPHVVTSADHPGVTSAVDTINNLLSVRMCSSAGCGGRMLDELCLRCPVLHVSILVLELALEIVVLQLSYELYLGEPKRPIVIKHLEASLQPLLSQSGQEGVAHLLSGGVDERSAACCAHPGSLTHKLTVLRCVSRNMEVVSPVIADSMDLLSSLLLLYSKVVEAYDGGDTDHDLVAEAIDGGGNEMLQVSSFIQGLISTFSVATLQHLDQDLVLSCGPAITETFINRLAT
ncbi:FANCA-like protein [Mya arenaria]|uniref:FANCA-like protein n=1 Tax=Mya arenaria TaxID=6604 RepID=A0ABY7ESX0_MYAAR|nr:FANCA-like protein [Mya arenaria]